LVSVAILTAIIHHQLHTAIGLRCGINAFSYGSLRLLTRQRAKCEASDKTAKAKGKSDKRCALHQVKVCQPPQRIQEAGSIESMVDTQFPIPTRSDENWELNIAQRLSTVCTCDYSQSLKLPTVQRPWASETRETPGCSPCPPPSDLGNSRH